MPAVELPLSALLSQALVAFIVEFDNEFELRTPHRTTNHGSTPGVVLPLWLASMAMWSTCMRFVDEKGVTIRELETLARTPTNLDGMRRWGYIRIGPEPAATRAKPTRRDWMIRPTPKGLMAREIWRPLFGEIEGRWRSRFGDAAIERLRQALRALVRQSRIDLPDCLPILGYGLYSRGPEPARAATPLPEDLPLPALLSRALLMFALDFEREADLSLAIAANVLRVLDEQGVRMRDIPQRAGVSKEAINIAMGILRKKNLAVIHKDRAVRLTPAGLHAQSEYARLLAAIEARFGADTILSLRAAMQPVSGDALFLGLQPGPDNWRASVPKPSTLPHYPMVLHRGGYPDGS